MATTEQVMEFWKDGNYILKRCGDVYKLSNSYIEDLHASSNDIGNYWWGDVIECYPVNSESPLVYIWGGCKALDRPDYVKSEDIIAIFSEDPTDNPNAKPLVMWDYVKYN